MSPSISLSFSLGQPTIVPESSGLPVTSGLQLHLDAQDTDTLIQDVPGRVRLWADKSPGGKDAVQNSAANQPFIDASTLNGKQSLSAAGAQWLVSPLTLSSIIGATGIMSYFVVYRTAPDFAIFRALLGEFQISPSVTRFSIRYNSAGSNEFGWGSVFENLSTPNSPNINTNVLTSFIARGTGAGGGFDVWNDGVHRVVDHTYGYSANVRPVWVLAMALNSSLSSSWVGNIGEFLIYDRAVTNGERLQIESYLSTRWGL